MGNKVCITPASRNNPNEVVIAKRHWTELFHDCIWQLIVVVCGHQNVIDHGGRAVRGGVVRGRGRSFRSPAPRAPIGYLTSGALDRGHS
jgi:hypothetical protein